MLRFFLLLALCSNVRGDAIGLGVVNPLVSAGNPYVAGRYPFPNRYTSPYYNPASATAPILSYTNNKGPDGSYSYSFTTGDGKQAQERGFLKNAYIDQTGSPQGTQVVEGSYSYTSPEGTPIQVSYIADEYGFRPSGDHIPANGKGSLPTSVTEAIVQPGVPFNYNNNYNPINGIYKPYNRIYQGHKGLSNGYNGLRSGYDELDNGYNGIINGYNGLNSGYNGYNDFYNNKNSLYNTYNGIYNPNKLYNPGNI